MTDVCCLSNPFEKRVRCPRPDGAKLATWGTPPPTCPQPSQKRGKTEGDEKEDPNATAGEPRFLGEKSAITEPGKETSPG